MVEGKKGELVSSISVIDRSNRRFCILVIVFPSPEPILR